MKTTLAAAAAIFLATSAVGSAADLAVKAPYISPAPIWSWTDRVDARFDHCCGSSGTCRLVTCPCVFPPEGVRVRPEMKRSPKLGQRELEFSGVRLMPAGAPMSHSTAISAPCCRSRYVAGLRYSLYANLPASTVRRQGSRTNACSDTQRGACR